MTVLLVGFDSAWTPTNAGAIVGVLRNDDGSYRELGDPAVANYDEATRRILAWQTTEQPSATIVLLDQPTIVRNAAGQRPVENIVASPISLRFGGMQPANTSRHEMFGARAPVWPFLTRFGGVPDPMVAGQDTRVFETYPSLAMIALDWIRPDARPTGRLPKYNPERRKTFLLEDWQHVCARAAAHLGAYGLLELARWLEAAGRRAVPRKKDQDSLDACICLLVALELVEQNDCLMVGDVGTGYIVVPHGEGLFDELATRCTQTRRDPSAWVRKFNLQTEGLHIERRIREVAALARQPKNEVTPRLYDAMRWVIDLFGRDSRKQSPTPVLSHLFGVCALVQQDGGEEDEAVAALLHDVLEDKPESVTRSMIAERFGSDVLELVEISTDTPAYYKGGTKPPWRERKQGYIGHVRRTDPSKLRVTLADKVDNLRAILADYRQTGESFWVRFNAGKLAQVWYYESVLAAYQQAGVTFALLGKLERLVGELQSATGISNVGECPDEET